MGLHFPTSSTKGKNMLALSGLDMTPEPVSVVGDRSEPPAPGLYPGSQMESVSLAASTLGAGEKEVLT